MKLGALIIESSNTKSGPLPGAAADAKKWFNFLVSPIGGAWERSEITLLSTPWSHQVSACLKDMSDADFAFVAFSGHGCHKHEGANCETCVELNDHRELKISELDCSAKRMLVIVDACREVVVVEERMIKAAAAKLELSGAATDRYVARQLFERSIEATAPGRVVLYSCSEGQTAADKGSFSQALIACGENFAADIPANSTIDVKSVFQETKEHMRGKSRGRQVPDADFTRRLTHFPFAVHF